MKDKRSVEKICLITVLLVFSYFLSAPAEEGWSICSYRTLPQLNKGGDWKPTKDLISTDTLTAAESKIDQSIIDPPAPFEYITPNGAGIYSVVWGPDFNGDGQGDLIVVQIGQTLPGDAVGGYTRGGDAMFNSAISFQFMDPASLQVNNAKAAKGTLDTQGNPQPSGWATVSGGEVKAYRIVKDGDGFRVEQVDNEFIQAINNGAAFAVYSVDSAKGLMVVSNDGIFIDVSGLAVDFEEGRTDASMLSAGSGINWLERPSSDVFLPPEIGLASPQDYKFTYDFGPQYYTLAVVSDEVIRPTSFLCVRPNPQSFRLVENDVFFMDSVSAAIAQVDFHGNVPEQIQDIVSARKIFWRGTDGYEPDRDAQRAASYDMLWNGLQTFGELLGEEFVCIEAAFFAEALLEMAGYDAHVEIGVINPETAQRMGVPEGTPLNHVWVVFDTAEGPMVMDPLKQVTPNIMPEQEFLDAYIVNGNVTASYDVFQHIDP
ncbi:MAG: hypothetical protein JW788_04360 [Candidatus Omnitrophica bacterium]|nr:hypothetical protein [Candidatus Omnitrophota bacterium]